MEAKIRTSDAVGGIVARFPGAAAILSKYNIDFCCGGGRPLSAAAADGGRDAAELAAELERAYEAFTATEAEYTDWATQNPARLTEHIVATHHAFLKRELPELASLLFRVLGVHGEGHPELFKVHSTFSSLRAELESHLIKEETLLFPAIAAGGTGSPRVAALLADLEAEHEAAGDALKELRELTDHHRAPEDACESYRALYRRLQAFEQDMFIHVHLENNILFKNPSVRAA